MSVAGRPPAAYWLLRRFVGGPTSESLIGDIEEEFSRGRSSSWYWRQVPPAILAGLKGDLRRRPSRVILSVILASTVTVAWVTLTSSLYDWVTYRWLNDFRDSSWLLFEFWVPFGGGVPFIWCLSSAFVGRLSARLTDRNQAALVGILLVQGTLSLWWTRGFWLYGAFTTAVSPALWVPNYLWAAIVLIGMPMSTIVGALWDVEDSRRTRPANTVD